MVSRPYKCPLCHSTFRNESGMKWHLAHRHEIPNAFDALGKDYEDKIVNLSQENDFLEKKLQIQELVLQKSQIDVFKERAAKELESLKVIKLTKDMEKMAIALAIRSSVLKERLNIELSDPLNY